MRSPKISKKGERYAVFDKNRGVAKQGYLVKQERMPDFFTLFITKLIVILELLAKLELMEHII